ncbi:hypothetical protein RUM43_006997 [Polyplax serrata]|uniref:GOLD domain-containing protein n=1 Tax=Polyplax serrata TaxID=468196 RepID=A0AAN8S579_POLSC
MFPHNFNPRNKMDLHLVFFVLMSGLLAVDAIMFHLEPNTRKCLREELQANVLVTGEFDVTEIHGQKVDYVVKDSKNHILTQNSDIKEGKFSFVTENYDTFEICFISRVPPQQQHVSRHEVSLIIKRGVEAKNYKGIQEAAKLKPTEAELRRLEDLSEDIVKDFSIMRKNEEEMRNTNESTNRRVLYFTVFSMCCLLGLATWQVFYLKNYFKAKKLIE